MPVTSAAPRPVSRLVANRRLLQQRQQQQQQQPTRRSAAGLVGQVPAGRTAAAVDRRVCALRAIALITFDRLLLRPYRSYAGDVVDSQRRRRTL